MGNLICGVTTISKGETVINLNGIKGDTIIASKEWVKNNLDKVLEWAKN
jgi:hypothetical protein